MVYTDDIMIIGDNVHDISNLNSHLQQEFQTKVKEIKYFLGTEVARFKKGVSPF